MRIFTLLISGLLAAPLAVAQQAVQWQAAWPQTDFSQSIVSFDEIRSGGPPKDGIPAIDNPTFQAARDVSQLGAQEPVVALKHNGVAKAYPLQILMWHEIVNDTIGDTPVAVTYCPLCNSAMVFKREVHGKTYTFGTSGKLRKSNLIMYDRQTESWWQQFSGQAIVGAQVGHVLPRMAARIIPFSAFLASHPAGQVLARPAGYNRAYGQNPYTKYDSAKTPYIYKGNYTGPGQPMDYVVSVKDQAWFLNNVRQRKVIEHNNIRLTWQAGMNSALDSHRISQGRDIGFVRVQQKMDGRWQDVPHFVTFAFTFKAFHPQGTLHTLKKQ